MPRSASKDVFERIQVSVKDEPDVFVRPEGRRHGNGRAIHTYRTDVGTMNVVLVKVQRVSAIQDGAIRGAHVLREVFARAAPVGFLGGWDASCQGKSAQER